jgi:type IV secretory pathway TrbL component
MIQSRLIKKCSGIHKGKFHVEEYSYAISSLSLTGHPTTGPRETHIINKRGKEINIMELSAPKKITFWIAVIIVVLGVIAWVFPITVVLGNLAMLVGFVLLVFGNIFKNL